MPSIRDRQTAWSALTQVAEDAATAMAKAEQRIEQIKASDMYAPDYKRQLIEQERAKLEQDTRELMGRSQTARDTLLEAAGELDSPQGDTTAQLLAETRQQRAWARIKPQLDAGVHWSTLLDQASAARDQHTLVALASELPAWLAATTAGSDAPVDTAQLRRALDIATFKALGDDKGPGTAARLRLHVETRFPIAELAIQQAVLGRDMTRAMSLVYAQREAADVDAKLGLTPQEAPPAVTREQFAGMNGAQRNELHQSNPDLYRELSGRTA